MKDKSEACKTQGGKASRVTITVFQKSCDTDWNEENNGGNMANKGSDVSEIELID